MMDTNAVTTREPVTPDNVTVLGSRVTPKSRALWDGLDLSRAVIREKSTIMVYCVGWDDAPADPHLDVPWMHPDDQARGHDADPDSWCVYRVRPRRMRGFLRFERGPDGWVIVRAANLKGPDA